MNTNSKINWLGGLLGICVIAIVVESYYLWNAHKAADHDKLQFVSGVSTSAATPPKNLNNPWADIWGPNSQFAQLQKQMNQLMNQMSTGNSIFSQQGFGLSSGSPKISMHENSDNYKVTVDVPKGQNIQINTDLSGNELTIDGKVKQSGGNQANGSGMQSLSVSQFSQTMYFPQPVNDSGMKIKRNDNQVVITVPKVG